MQDSAHGDARGLTPRVANGYFDGLVPCLAPLRLALLILFFFHSSMNFFGLGSKTASKRSQSSSAARQSDVSQQPSRGGPFSSHSAAASLADATTSMAPAQPTPPPKPLQKPAQPPEERTVPSKSSQCVFVFALHRARADRSIQGIVAHPRKQAVICTKRTTTDLIARRQSGVPQSDGHVHPSRSQGLHLWRREYRSTVCGRWRL